MNRGPCWLLGVCYIAIACSPSFAINGVHFRGELQHIEYSRAQAIQNSVIYQQALELGKINFNPKIYLIIVSITANKCPRNGTKAGELCTKCKWLGPRAVFKVFSKFSDGSFPFSLTEVSSFVLFFSFKTKIFVCRWKSRLHIALVEFFDRLGSIWIEWNFGSNIWLSNNNITKFIR